MVSQWKTVEVFLFFFSLFFFKKKGRKEEEGKGKRKEIVCAPMGLISRLSSARSAFPLGFVFDIDGVLLRGNVPLPGARDTLLSLMQSEIPWICLTNGGGELESSKARKLSKILSLPVHPSQIVLSHTPMRSLCLELKSKRVLVLGCRDVRGVANAYGLTKVHTPLDILHDTPSLYPFLEVPQDRVGMLSHRDEPFGAILVLHDPNSWGLEIQIALDVLCGGDHRSGRQVTPYFASNPDLTFAGSFPGAPRLAAGAFTAALAATWAATMPPHTPSLQTTFFGKPNKLTFDYAKGALVGWAAWAEEVGWHSRAAKVANGNSGGLGGLVEECEERDLELGSTSKNYKIPQSAVAFESIVMVGDNPKADIVGANVAGAPWKSVLVKTGVWQGEVLHGAEVPGVCAPTVRHAVETFTKNVHSEATTVTR